MTQGRNQGGVVWSECTLSYKVKAGYTEEGLRFVQDITRADRVSYIGSISVIYFIC